MLHKAERRRPNGFTRACVWLAFALFLSSCTTLSRAAYTEQEANAAVIDGFPSARMWADAPIASFINSALRPRPQPGQPFTYLALSGGGGEGAYGAGMLAGWSARGTRPEFTMVSGVSTGALIAPFAFLGPKYDGVLKELYTSGIASTFIASPQPLKGLLGPAFFSDQPLRDAVRRYATQPLLDAIAAQYAKGRRLLVVTTDLDNDRPVVWDMGAIASTRSPKALGLFQDVLTASASIPAIFPPVLIRASANGRSFQEMHVDGTITTPVFTFPDSFLLDPDFRHKLTGEKPALYILMNNRIDPTFHVVDDVSTRIVSRSFSTKNKQDSRAILAATYQIARRNGLDFNLTFISPSVPESGETGFETDYMRKLYAIGYDKGLAGEGWVHKPPTSNAVAGQGDQAAAGRVATARR